MFYALSQSQIRLTWIEENIINYNVAEGGPSEKDRISHYEENIVHSTAHSKPRSFALYDDNMADPAQYAPIYI